MDLLNLEGVSSSHKDNLAGPKHDTDSGCTRATTTVYAFSVSLDICFINGMYVIGLRSYR